MFLISTIPTFLNELVLVSNVLFIVLLALFLFSARTRKWLVSHISQHILKYTLLFSLVATLGSLSLSIIVGWVPCDLCWFQRIFMYPEVVISIAALMCLGKNKEENIRKGIFVQAVYSILSLAVIGSMIALFHSYIQWGGTYSILPCTLNGGECGKLYIYAHHYITIPFMALSAFVYIISFSLVYIFATWTKKK